MLDKDVGRLRLSSSAQYSKALVPMLVTETGMPMCVRLPHWLKAYSLRVVTESGMFTIPVLPEGQLIRVFPSLLYSMPSIDL